MRGTGRPVAAALRLGTPSARPALAGTPLPASPDPPRALLQRRQNACLLLQRIPVRDPTKAQFRSGWRLAMRSRFHCRPEGSTWRGAWMMTGMGRKQKCVLTSPTVVHV